MRQLLVLILISVVMGLVAACGASATPTPTLVPPTATPVPPPEPNAVAYSAVNYAFAGPATLPSGLTEITLTNVSDELHMQQLIKLPDDMTIGDFMTVLAESAPEDPPPPGIESAGGVSVIGPEISATTIIDLEAGNYIMICFVADPEGVPHFALGMLLPLTVTPATGPAAQEPESTISVDMVDFGFDLSSPITAGPQVIEANNLGSQEHEFFFVKLAPGATIDEALEALEFGGADPPPGVALGGLQAVGPGRGGFVTIDFAPGEYAMVCAIPDVDTGAPHFALGMLHQFTIQ